MCSILAIVFGLIRHKKCCSTYKLPNDVLKKIGTLVAYSKKTLMMLKVAVMKTISLLHQLFLFKIKV